MRPDRLVVGEVREAESLDLLIALNSGLPGMCSIHANSARDALCQTVHPAAARRAQHRFGVRAADRGQLHRHRGALRDRPARQAPRVGDHRAERSAYPAR